MTKSPSDTTKASTTTTNAVVVWLIDLSVKVIFIQFFYTLISVIEVQLR